MSKFFNLVWSCISFIGCLLISAIVISLFNYLLAAISLPEPIIKIICAAAFGATFVIVTYIFSPKNNTFKTFFIYNALMGTVMALAGVGSIFNSTEYTLLIPISMFAMFITYTQIMSKFKNQLIADTKRNVHISPDQIK